MRRLSSPTRKFTHVLGETLAPHEKEARAQRRRRRLRVVRSGRLVRARMTCLFPGESSSGALQARTDAAVPSRMERGIARVPIPGP